MAVLLRLRAEKLLGGQSLDDRRSSRCSEHLLQRYLELFANSRHLWLIIQVIFYLVKCLLLIPIVALIKKLSCS